MPGDGPAGSHDDGLRTTSIGRGGSPPEGSARDAAKDSLGQSRSAVRADAHQVSSEPLGFLPDRFGDVAFLDDGDFSLDSARDGVRRHLRTQAFLGASNDLDRYVPASGARAPGRGATARAGVTRVLHKPCRHHDETPICAKLSPTTWLTIMPTPNHSAGRPPPTPSSKRSLTYVM